MTGGVNILQKRSFLPAPAISKNEANHGTLLKLVVSNSFRLYDAQEGFRNFSSRLCLHCIKLVDDGRLLTGKDTFCGQVDGPHAGQT